MAVERQLPDEVAPKRTTCDSTVLSRIIVSLAGAIRGGYTSIRVRRQSPHGRPSYPRCFHACRIRWWGTALPIGRRVTTSPSPKRPVPLLRQNLQALGDQRRALARQGRKASAELRHIERQRGKTRGRTEEAGRSARILESQLYVITVQHTASLSRGTTRVQAKT